MACVALQLFFLALAFRCRMAADVAAWNALVRCVRQNAASGGGALFIGTGFALKRRHVFTVGM